MSSGRALRCTDAVVRVFERVLNIRHVYRYMSNALEESPNASRTLFKRPKYW